MALPPDRGDSVMVVRGLDRDKSMKCLQESDPDSTATIDGAFITWRHRSGTMNLMTFANSSTLVMLGAKHPTKEALQRVLTLGAPLRRNAGFVALANNVGRGAAVTCAVESSPRLQEEFGGRFGASVRALMLSIRVGGARLEWTGRVVVGSAQEATDVAERLRPNLEAARGMLERFDMRPDGDSVAFDGALTDAQIEAIVAIVRPMLNH
jgi:hypothetical protein